MRFNRFSTDLLFLRLDVNHSPRLEPVVVNARQCDHKQAFASNPAPIVNILLAITASNAPYSPPSPTQRQRLNVLTIKRRLTFTLLSKTPY